MSEQPSPRKITEEEIAKAFAVFDAVNEYQRRLAKDDHPHAQVRADAIKGLRHSQDFLISLGPASIDILLDAALDPDVEEEAKESARQALLDLGLVSKDDLARGLKDELRERIKRIGISEGLWPDEYHDVS